jgi:hypothetical protein
MQKQDSLEKMRFYVGSLPLIKVDENR